jgi:hypothetical protein
VGLVRPSTTGFAGGPPPRAARREELGRGRNRVLRSLVSAAKGLLAL